MTAPSWPLHQEFHSEAFTRRGSTLEMIQLWVNLPAKHKMGAPCYQTSRSTDTPVVDLGRAGSVWVIRGKSEAATYSDASRQSIAICIVL